MALVCCVEGCGSQYEDDITYFPFPIKQSLRRQWRDAVRLPRLPLDPAVCSRHFPPAHCSWLRGRLRLKPGTVPSIFPNRTPPSNIEDTEETESTQEDKNANKDKRKKGKRKEIQEKQKNGNNNKKSKRKTSTIDKNSEETVDSVNKENEKDYAESSKSDSKDQEPQNSNTVIQENKDSESRIEETQNSKTVNQETENSGLLDQEKVSNENGEIVEFTPDIAAFFENKDHLDSSVDENGAEKCTIECVPEAVLAGEDSELSEAELSKEDIEDIIANYHIQRNKRLADRLKAAQEKEQQNSELPKETEASQNSQTRETETENCKNTENRKRKDDSPVTIEDQDEDVEFISSEIRKQNFIEVPVDKGPNSRDNDCMMLLEDVQVAIDPASLFFAERDDGDDDSVEEVPQGKEDRKEDPISLVTSSDESDVIIQEPHIDTVEVSDEDEDDLPLVKLVNFGDEKSSRSEKLQKAKKIGKLLWEKYMYYCYKCNFSTLSSIDYHNHKLKHARVIQMCDVCLYTTASEAQFIRHRKKHKDEKRFACHLCDYKAKHQMSLVYHLQSHENVSVDSLRTFDVDYHSESDKVSGKGYKKTKNSYRCLNCKFSRKTKKEMLQHQKVCSRRMHPCDKCDYKTKRRSDLRRHKSRKHRDEEDDVDYVP